MLRGLPEEFLSAVSLRMKSYVFSAGDIVLRSGDASLPATMQTIYVLLTGEIQLRISRTPVELPSDNTSSVVDTGATTVAIQLIRAGQQKAVFGTYELFPPGTLPPSSWSIEAASFCDIAVVQRSDFAEVVADYPSIRSHFPWIDSAMNRGTGGLAS
eukprot:SAG31_NODE_5155_length_2711_cov_2.412711_3_plen_156_part_01